MTYSLLNFSASTDKDQLPAGQANSDLSCQIIIEPVATDDEDRSWSTRANICLLVDCSGSMHGRKFEAAVATAKMIVDILHERHMLSLVAFQTRSHIIFQNAVPSADNKEFLKSEIDHLERHLGGMTDLASGIEHAMEGFANSTADSNIVLIISDGEPNSVEKAQKQAELASQAGVQFHAVGIGDSYNADQLLGIVTPSNGAVYGDSEVANIDKIFRNLINRIDRIFATNVRLEIEFDGRAYLHKVFRTRPARAPLDISKLDKSDTSLNLQVGNIEGDKIYEFLLQFDLDPFEAGVAELIRIKFFYDVHANGVRQTESVDYDLHVTFTGDEPEPEPEPEPIPEPEPEPEPVPEPVRETVREPVQEPVWQPVREPTKRSEPEPEPDDELEPVYDFTNASMFDLVLIDAGPEPIRLMRDLRNATEMELHVISSLIRGNNCTLSSFKDILAADRLKQVVANAGARAQVRPRERILLNEVIE